MRKNLWLIVAAGATLITLAGITVLSRYDLNINSPAVTLQLSAHEKR